MVKLSYQGKARDDAQDALETLEGAGCDPDLLRRLCSNLKARGVRTKSSLSGGTAREVAAKLTYMRRVAADMRQLLKSLRGRMASRQSETYRLLPAR